MLVLHRGFVACPWCRLIWGRCFYIHFFSPTSHLFGGGKSLQQSRACCLFSCVCWRSLCAGGKRSFPAFLLLIRETVVCFFTWLAAPCGRSGWPGPGMSARDARVYLFGCSLPQKSLLILWSRPNAMVLVLHRRFVACPWCRLIWGGCFYIHFFSPASHLFWGRQVSPALHCMLPLSCVFWHS